jgi:hypothetical protein
MQKFPYECINEPYCLKEPFNTVAPRSASMKPAIFFKSSIGELRPSTRSSLHNLGPEDIPSDGSSGC